MKVYGYWPRVMGLKIGPIEIQYLGYGRGGIFALDLTLDVGGFSYFYGMFGLCLFGLRFKLRAWIHRKSMTEKELTTEA